MQSVLSYGARKNKRMGRAEREDQEAGYQDLPGPTSAYQDLPSGYRQWALGYVWGYKTCYN